MHISVKRELFLFQKSKTASEEREKAIVSDLGRVCDLNYLILLIFSRSGFVTSTTSCYFEINMVINGSNDEPVEKFVKMRHHDSRVCEVALQFGTTCFVPSFSFSVCEIRDQDEEAGN